MVAISCQLSKPQLTIGPTFALCPSKLIHNITKLHGCIMWDHVSGKNNSPINSRLLVHEEHSSVLWSFQQETINSELF